MQEQSPGEALFQGKLIKLRVQSIPQPGGGTKRFEIVEHPDAVAIVALRYDPVNDSGAVVGTNSVPILSGRVYPYIIAVVIFAIVLLLNIRYYQHSLNVHNELAVIKEQAEELEM